MLYFFPLNIIALSLIGFDSIKSTLLASYQNNKLHHAILFYGKKGVGKATFAKHFALEILQQTNVNHPDLLYIEKEEEKRDITIDQIRKISNFTNQTSSISKNKFIIINAADDLNRNAANALLKMLEEPHANNFLILISHSLGKLLPTIKSRCQLVKINDLTFEEFTVILKKNRPSVLPKLSDDEIKILAEICDNSPALALEAGEDLIELYNNFLSSIKNKKINEQIFKKISDKSFNFEIFIKVVNFFLQRLSLYNAGLMSYFLFTEKEIFTQLNTKFNKEKLFNLSDNIGNSLSKTIPFGLDKKLILINIFNQICFE